MIDEETANSKDALRLRFEDLLQYGDVHHLIYAAPGSGKSHSLHHLAETILRKWETPSKASEVPDGGFGIVDEFSKFPILLPIGGLKTADSVMSIIRTMQPEIDPIALLQHENVCVLLDGWSEFATNDSNERTILLQALDGVRTIATARRLDNSDATFKCWSLARLSPNEIQDVLRQDSSCLDALDEQVVDLLRLPLMLSLYLLLGGETSTQGELIANFHQHVSKKLPEKFDDVLADAVSTLSLKDERSYVHFLAALRKAATNCQIVEPQEVLHKLGTLMQRGKVVVAIHDLYWSWLSGVGILRGSKINQALTELATRESLNLALQSGEIVEPTLIAEIANTDVVLAATFDASLHNVSTNSCLALTLKKMFEHPHFSVRCRAAIAGVRTGRSHFFGKALLVIDEMAKEKLYVPELVDALDIAVLFANRSALGAWLGGPGTDIVADAIAANGSGQWVPWLEQMFVSGQLGAHQALYITLACSAEIPKWGFEHLPSLVASEPWKLQFTANRRVNRQLAVWLSRNYPVLSGGNFSSGWDSNRVLVSCGDDAVFEELLANFPSMAPSSQEVLSMAIPELGDEWVAKFQKIAFSKPGRQNCRRLAETVSSKIDDSTAREWIACGYYLEGWGVLVARHGIDMLPELMRELPYSFAGHPNIQALEVISTIKGLPASLLDEFHQRLFFNTTDGAALQPRVIEYVIKTAAAIRPLGMAWLIKMSFNTSIFLNSYYGRRLLEHYREWSRDTGMVVNVGPKNSSMLFDEMFATTHFITKWDEIWGAEALRSVPKVAIKAVIGSFSLDDDMSKKILLGFKGLTTFNPELFERMINSTMLAPLIPDVFSEVLNQVPPNQLLQLVQSDDLEDVPIFYALRSATEPSFRDAHMILVKRLISEPLNLHYVRNVANMLKNYDREQLIEFFSSMLTSEGTPGNDCLHWLLREVCTLRRELFIDEQGRLLC
ncbi:hypothetical protein F506_20130 [Herbaspirillum hiltneri N3]|uniref:ATP-binding protein n=1 Tax=Herbaspirillum hiltneri N3 TaxID=1262470 RepID=A0ABM5V4Y6_9BURK|nr:hypothetical protein F506_20130 [Herbaspirillum hiltneri N3]